MNKIHSIIGKILLLLFITICFHYAGGNKKSTLSLPVNMLASKCITTKKYDSIDDLIQLKREVIQLQKKYSTIKQPTDLQSQIELKYTELRKIYPLLKNMTLEDLSNSMKDKYENIDPKTTFFFDIEYLYILRNFYQKHLIVNVDKVSLSEKEFIGKGAGGEVYKINLKGEYVALKVHIYHFDPDAYNSNHVQLLDTLCDSVKQGFERYLFERITSGERLFYGFVNLDTGTPCTIMNLIANPDGSIPEDSDDDEIVLTSIDNTRQCLAMLERLRKYGLQLPDGDGFQPLVTSDGKVHLMDIYLDPILEDPTDAYSRAVKKSHPIYTAVEQDLLGINPFSRHPMRNNRSFMQALKELQISS